MASSDFEAIGNVIRGAQEAGIQIDGEFNLDQAKTNYPVRFALIGNQLRDAISPVDSGSRGIFFRYVLTGAGAVPDAYFVCQSNVISGFRKSGVYIRTVNQGVVGGNIAQGNNTSGDPNENQFYYTGGDVATLQRYGNIGTWNV